MWREIRRNFYNEEEGKVYIDAWETDRDGEEGKVIAKIDVKTKNIEYLNQGAMTDAYAQEIIKQVMEDIDNGIFDAVRNNLRL